MLLMIMVACRFEEETQPGLVASEAAAKRLIDLGLVFTPVEDAVIETVESLRARGYLKKSGELHSSYN